MSSLKMSLKMLICVLLGLVTSEPRIGFGGLQQDWDFVTVREGAHMFWWLHYTLAVDVNHAERPLVIWLQGGPGASSTGYGNFEELGPFDLDVVRRDFTWINDLNVLFIDNPVGTGYSYVDDSKYLTTDNRQIALDLVAMLKGFYERLPEFKDTPLHIMSESYGGKMAAEFALMLHREIEAGTIECNLISTGLIDSWMSPIDFVMAWSPFLLQLGFVDVDGYEKIQKSAYLTKLAVDTKKWEEATRLWGETETVLEHETHNIDFYNILFKVSSDSQRSDKNSNLLRNRQTVNETMYRSMVSYSRLDAIDDAERDAKLSQLMKTQVHEALNLPSNVEWGSQSNEVFRTLARDFMKPVTHIVEELLEKTDIKVIVISGTLDLICATPGTVKWVNNLKWSGANNYKAAPREAFGVNGVIEGYSRQEENFSMYWILRSGHMVPYDNPIAMSHILKEFTGFA